MIQHASRSHAALSDQSDQPGDSDEEMAPEEMSELKGFNMPLLLGRHLHPRLFSAEAEIQVEFCRCHQISSQIYDINWSCYNDF